LSPVGYNTERVLFGRVVALHGDTAAVSARSDDDQGEDSGSCYVFVRDRALGVWTQQAKLLPSDGFTRNSFGFFLGLEGDTLLVSSPGNWVDLAAADGFASAITDFARANDTVRETGQTVFIGSAYVFWRNSEGNWSQVGKFISDGDRFGGIAVVNDDRCYVSAWRYDETESIVEGSGYIYNHFGNEPNYQFEGKFVDQSNYTPGGLSSDMDGNVVVTGVAFEDQGKGEYSIVSKRDGGNWTILAKDQVRDGEPNDWLGWSVSLSGRTAVIGSPGDRDRGAFTGSAYVIDLTLLADELDIEF